VLSRKAETVLLRAVLALLVGVAVGGCGAQQRPVATVLTTTASPSVAAAVTTPKPAPTPPPRQATPAQLRAALLTPRDLPAGFQVDHPTGGNPSYLGATPVCTRAINTMYDEKPPAAAIVRLIRPFPGGRQVEPIEEDLGSWPGDGAARSMADTGQAPARCSSWYFHDADYGTVRTRAVPLAYPPIAEQTHAYALTTHWPGAGDTHELLVFARSDTRRVVFDCFAPLGRTLNRARCDAILRTALAKLPHWRHA
jgi:hypothetical protein